MPDPIDTEGVVVDESCDKTGPKPEPLPAPAPAKDGLPLDLSDLSDAELARLEADALGDLERQARVIGRGIRRFVEDDPREGEGYVGQFLRVFGVGK